MYFHQTSTGLSPRKGASCCSSELLNVYLMRYSGWCRPGTLSADMLWRLRENQWVEGVPSREAAAETKMLSSHTFLVIFNHLKLICLQSVSSALAWPPACSGCTTELLNIPVPHQYISHFTITPHHSSVFRQYMNPIAWVSKRDFAWANSWCRRAPPKPMVYIAIDRMTLLQSVFCLC